MRCCPKRDNRISYTLEDGAVNPSAIPVSVAPAPKERRNSPSTVLIVSLVVVATVTVIGGIIAVCAVLIVTPTDSRQAANETQNTSGSETITPDSLIDSSLLIQSLNVGTTLHHLYTENPPIIQTFTPRKLHKEISPNLTSICASNEFHCGNGECISATLRCNQVRNCQRGDDEFNCTCVDRLRSLFPQKLCDRIDDCSDGSDEFGCSYCHSGEFMCHINSECVAKELQCNGHADCADGEDEKICTQLVPEPQEIPVGKLRSKGFVVVQVAGIWYPVCFNLPVIISHNQHPLFDHFCKMSGYKSVRTFDFISPGSHSVIGYQTVSSSTTPDSFIAGLRFERSCSNGKLLNLTCADPVCGLAPRCEARRSRIVGGTNVGNGCFPWAVALYKSGQLNCMAVVLNEEWLITAAHCFTEKLRSHYWTARLGFYRQFSESPYEEVRLIDQVIRHPGYSELPIENNDIALVHLNTPVMFSDYIRPVCLPKSGGQPGSGISCIVAGWGFKDEEEKFPADELQQTSLTVMLKERCNSSSQFKGLVKSTHLCLSHGAEMKDACQGDSGGPLLCPNPYPNDPVKYYLAGITSTGYGCARPDLPGIWTSVADYIPWIQEMLASPEVHSRPVGLNNVCFGFRCRLGDCVYKWLKCDGQSDCLIDGSDEHSCGT